MSRIFIPFFFGNSIVHIVSESGLRAKDSTRCGGVSKSLPEFISAAGRCENLHRPSFFSCSNFVPFYFEVFFYPLFFFVINVVASFGAEKI